MSQTALLPRTDDVQTYVDEKLLAELIADRPGWRPQDWAAFLKIKANMSQDLTPIQAATYRKAAEVVCRQH